MILYWPLTPCNPVLMTADVCCITWGRISALQQLAASNKCGASKEQQFNA
jgi:hypothetical protein